MVVIRVLYGWMVLLLSDVFVWLDRSALLTVVHLLSKKFSPAELLVDKFSNSLSLERVIFLGRW